MLRKGVYLYEFMDDSKKFNETSLPEKEKFFGNLKWKILQIQMTIMQRELVKISNKTFW